MYALTPYPITPIGNFIGVVLALLPLISQMRKLSLAVWGYAIWIAVCNFQNFVNTVIWHDNVNVVVPVWCDIATKLQIGASVGPSACALAISIRLYKITRLRGFSETDKQRRKIMIYELLLVVGLPVVIMALFIIVQPTRFEIDEEFGCGPDIYSYVGYIIHFGPVLIASLGCVILAPLTLHALLLHRKEMSDFLSSSRDITHSKYTRLMVIACLDTLFNLPVSITLIITDILQGKSNGLNYPFISWKNVHDGAGGNLPGLSLSTIVQVPASAWSTDPWAVFTIKWNEWLYVFHTILFFGVFGTTPEMREHCRSAFWFVPERLGYKRPRASKVPVETVSDVVFNSNPGQQVGNRPTANRRRGSLSFLETTIDTGASRSGAVIASSDLESGVTTNDTGAHRIDNTTATVEGDESQVGGGV